jgi:peptidoglycan hydrolase CwlO-like protein
VDKRLADEAARSAKLDTEYKLLKRENGKLEVRCKALHRDLLRLQVSCSGSADGVAALASDKAALLEELATLRQDSAVTALRLVDATESLLREKGAAESESRRAEELRRENAELAVQVQELRTQMREPRASFTVGTDTEDLRPVAKRSEPPRRAEESDLVGDMRGDALEANIARLTRLADALLHRD